MLSPCIIYCTAVPAPAISQHCEFVFPPPPDPFIPFLTPFFVPVVQRPTTVPQGGVPVIRLPLRTLRLEKTHMGRYGASGSLDLSCMVTKNYRRHRSTVSGTSHLLQSWPFFPEDISCKSLQHPFSLPPLCLWVPADKNYSNSVNRDIFAWFIQRTGSEGPYHAICMSGGSEYKCVLLQSYLDAAN